MASCDFLVEESARNPPEPNRPTTYPTPPRPTRAAREAGFEQILSTSARMPLSTKSGSRRNGTVEEGLGLVGDFSVEHRLALSIHDIHTISAG